MHRRGFVIGLTTGSFGVCAQQPPAAKDAVEGIVAAFKQRPVVILGESHWLRQAGEFYVRLVRNPSFQAMVQDIVVEFASRQNQGLLDRYIGGEDLPAGDVARIWRDTTKVASWESPVYARWLAAIRDVNRTLPAARRLRVLAGDTSIDWSRIQTHDEWAALGDNNESFASVIVNEVIRNKRRAFVVLGSGHVGRSGGRDGSPTTTTLVESRAPGSTFVILLLAVDGMLDRPTENLLRLPGQTAPALFDLHDDPWKGAADKAGALLSKRTDALLYLGPPATLTQELPAPGSLEPSYLKEIDRRSMIEWGELRARKFLGPAARL